MVITLITIFDAAQYGERIAEALERYTDHTIYSLNGDSSIELHRVALAAADVIWVTNDYLAQIYEGKFYMILKTAKSRGCGMPVKKNVILIASATGGYYRRFVKGYEEHSMGIYPLSMYRDNFDLVAPDTPDLVYPGMDDVIMPIPWNTEDHKNMYAPTKNITIGAYQGMGKDRKGVKEYLLPAIEIAKKKGINVSLVLSESCYSYTQEEYIKRLSTCTLCYEQITPIGVYGNCGVQQLSIGVPTIVNIESVYAYGSIRNYGTPCIKASGIDDIVNIFKDIRDNKIDLPKISKMSREYALRWHSYKAIAGIAEMLIDMAQEKIRLGVGRRNDVKCIMELYDPRWGSVPPKQKKKSTYPFKR